MDSSTYYNQHAAEYLSSTQNVDMSRHYEMFLPHIPLGGHILDAGCGSGRDTLYFLEKGYLVEAFDLSQAMVNAAHALTGLPVRQLSFQQMDYQNAFDGIWACASLLHVPLEELSSVFKNLAVAVKTNGFVYCSFKYGTENYEQAGRYFTCFTRDSFLHFLIDIPWFTLYDMTQSPDLRPGREKERWLNILLVKS
ncbi:MAG: class I SAM-dependent methyltransferase [Sphaerochaetaceae bacterium]